MALFLRPEMLEHVRLSGPVEPIQEAIEEPVPGWAAARLSYNQAWIDAAQRRLEGLTWEEFLQAHGFLPGDRSIRDMMFTYDLRSSDGLAEYNRRSRVDCEPEFGALGYGPEGAYTRCADELYVEERGATLLERRSANDLVDRYLANEPER